jgi:hypothetical protein
VIAGPAVLRRAAARSTIAWLKSTVSNCLVGIALAALVGCGDDAPGADAGNGPDAAGPTVDAHVNADARQDCPVPANFIAPAGMSAGAVQDGSGSVAVEFDLDGAAEPDRFQLTLVAGRGVFIDGLVTGTFGINGAQLDNDSCALCLVVLADVDGAGTPKEIYFAEDGVIQLDSVSGQLTGSLTDVSFQHVSISPDPPHAITPILDGCKTRISSMGFDVPITSP